MIEHDRIRVRRDTTFNWKKYNPKLKIGEVAVDIDLHRTKIGDGVNNYIDLPYQYNELYDFLYLILKMIADIEGDGNLLDYIPTTYNLVNLDFEPIIGDIIYIKSEKTFYYYTKDREWKILSLNSIKAAPIVTDFENDLYTKYKNSSIGTLIYVKENKHLYLCDGNNWILQRSKLDDVPINVISVDELNKLNNIKDGTIVFVLSEKKFYYYDGINWKKSKIS